VEQHGYGVTAADLLGDGSREVLAAAEGADGEALLVGYDAHGAERFRHAFPRFSGKPPAWNSGGILHWVAAPILGAGRTRICATLRRTVMHTDETVVVDPATGREAWWQDNLEKRGCGGRPVALAQKPQGGCVIVGQYPDIHYILDGLTGKPIVVKTLGGKDLGGWVAYGSPILCDFNGDGALEALTGACNYVLAVMTLDREVLWHTPYLEGTTSQAGIRKNADRWEIGAATYYRGGFHCYAAKDGRLLWSFKPPRNVTTDIVTCDMDGDGVEEFIFGSGRTLYALGSTGDAPTVKWQLDLAGAVHSPICADVDGDGRSEVLALAADGNLYCIGE
jgi:outer membrane protein assembly factor BamB